MVSLYGSAMVSLISAAPASLISATMVSLYGSDMVSLYGSAMVSLCAADMVSSTLGLRRCNNKYHLWRGAEHNDRRGISKSRLKIEIGEKKKRKICVF